jgi:hypothetical protein
MTTNDMLSFTIFKNRIVKALITKGFLKVSFVYFLQNILSKYLQKALLCKWKYK